jgi:hypothetical protein
LPGCIWIIGNKDILQAVIAGKQTANEDVRGFVRKWRAISLKEIRRLLAAPLRPLHNIEAFSIISSS